MPICTYNARKIEMIEKEVAPEQFILTLNRQDFLMLFALLGKTGGEELSDLYNGMHDIRVDELGICYEEYEAHANPGGIMMISKSA
jgi:hypothetical protein